jgi:hypothetical protein
MNSEECEMYHVGKWDGVDDMIVDWRLYGSIRTGAYLALYLLCGEADTTYAFGYDTMICGFLEFWVSGFA